MKSIRKGTSCLVSWSIFTKDGNAYDLKGKDLTLIVSAPGTKMTLQSPKFALSENKILWLFSGAEQVRTGPYTLTLVIDKGLSSMVTIDKCNAFELVEWSCMTGGSEEEELSTDLVELESDLRIADAVLIEKTIIKSTYSELKEARDSAKLVPGQMYRITDYKTTAYQYDRYCHAEVPKLHQFDIIVEATGTNTLSEKAKACRHTEEASDYFSESNLDAWEIWYDLDNNRNKYAWACDGSYIKPLESFLINGKWYNPILNTDDEYQAAIADHMWLLCREQGDEHYSALISSGDLNPTFDCSGIVIGVECRVYPEGIETAGSSITTDLTTGYHAATVDFICRENGHQLEEGTGVIYRMIDEFGNDCPYDFKNIQFARTTVDVPDGVDADPTHSRWLHNYMQVIHSNNSVADAYRYAGNAIGDGYRFYEDEFTDDDSTTVHGKGLIASQIYWFYTFHETFSENGEDMSRKSYCRHNIMKPHIVTYRDINKEAEGPNGNHIDLMVIKQTLNNNIFINECINSDVTPTLPSVERYYYQCYNNRLEANCYMNTFGSGCYNLTMGENCHHNILGIDAADITMGKHCRYINLGNYCRFDIFDNYCLSLATAQDFNSNTLSTACRFMSFRADCSFNRFGINCIYQRFGEYCRYNIFGNYCNQNLFRDYMFSNTFGNYCNNMSLGTRWQYNSFGNNVTGIVIPTSGSYKNNVNYFYNNRFLSGLSYIAIAASTTGDKNTPVTNYTFHPSLSGTSESRTNLFKGDEYILRTGPSETRTDRDLYIYEGAIIVKQLGYEPLYKDTDFRTAFARKVDMIEGKGLSTNDYTDEDKAKVGFIGLEVGNEGELLDNFLLVLNEANYLRPHCGPCMFYIDGQYVCGTYFMNGINPPEGGVDEFVIFSQDYSENDGGRANLYIMGVDAWSGNVWIKKRINLSDLSLDIATQSEIDALFDNGTSGGSTSY